MDCGLAALATYLNLRYEDLYVVAAKMRPKRKGLNLKQLQAISNSLGHPLKRFHKGAYDIEEDSGVLGILWNDPNKNPSLGHYVTLRNGSILDPVQPSNLYDWSEYLVLNHARPVTLLSLK